MSQNVVSLSGVHKSYALGEYEVHALRGVDLSIAEGEFTVIMGPSGSGKSTLLNLLGCIDLPSTGTVEICGQNTNDRSEKDLAALRRENIGFIFQAFNLIPVLSVYENVEQPLTYGKIGSAERKDRVMAVLDRVGLADRARQRPTQLSGGHQQLVSIARAIVGNPTVLLADEPTGNLDSASGEVVMNLMKQLHASGTTVCMVTHDSRFLHLADRKIEMLDGKMVREN